MCPVKTGPENFRTTGITWQTVPHYPDRHTHNIRFDVNKYPVINVLSIFAGFRAPKVTSGITPLRFQLPDGQSHRIAQVRQSHVERVGQTRHYHFVVRSTEQRYFHIVFDAGKLTWHLVQEVNADLLFNE